MEKKYELPKEFAEKWVAALREEPETRHCRGVYNNKRTCQYCAMGLGLLVNDIPLNRHGDNVADGYEDLFMNSEISVKGKSIWFAIYELNDKYHLTFSEIANWVTKNVNFI